MCLVTIFMVLLKDVAYACDWLTHVINWAICCSLYKIKHFSTLYAKGDTYFHTWSTEMLKLQHVVQSTCTCSLINSHTTYTWVNHKQTHCCLWAIPQLSFTLILHQVIHNLICTNTAQSHTFIIHEFAIRCSRFLKPSYVALS